MKDPILNEIPFEHCLNIYTPGTLIVLGDAPGGVEELTLLRSVFPGAKVMAVNRASQKCVPDAVASLHSAGKDLIGFNIPPGCVFHTLHAPGLHEGEYLRRWKIEPNCGSSALFAVAVGIAMGYKQIITAGVRLDSYPYNTDIKIRCWGEIWHHIFKHYVTGMSGLPREIYGAPAEFK